MEQKGDTPGNSSCRIVLSSDARSLLLSDWNTQHQLSRSSGLHAWMRTTALGVLGPQLANHRCRDFLASIILRAIYTHRETHTLLVSFLWRTLNSTICACRCVVVAVVQSLSHTQLFATPWAAKHQASLSFTISWSLLKLMSIESTLPSNHLILCRPLLLLPSIFLSIMSFPMSWLFTSGGQSIGTPASVLPVDIQD